jgi:hypothetical protein
VNYSTFNAREDLTARGQIDFRGQIDALETRLGREDLQSQLGITTGIPRGHIHPARGRVNPKVFVFCLEDVLLVVGLYRSSLCFEEKTF